MRSQGGGGTNGSSLIRGAPRERAHHARTASRWEGVPQASGPAGRYASVGGDGGRGTRAVVSGLCRSRITQEDE